MNSNSSSLTRSDLYDLMSSQAGTVGDSFTLPNGDDYFTAGGNGKPVVYTKNGQPISQEEYQRGNSALFEAMPTLPLATPAFPVPADASPEAAVAAFNQWGKVNIARDLFSEGSGYFTEEAVYPAREFMATTCFASTDVELAKESIARKKGYDPTSDLGLEHQVEAAWLTPDGRIIFYCSLQGGMFVL